MREVRVGERAEGEQVLQAPERPHAGVLHREALLDVLEEHLDAPAAEVGVRGEDRGPAQLVRRGVRAGEVQRVEVERPLPERARHHEDGRVRVSGREEPRAPAHLGLGAARGGAQRRADAGRPGHALADAPPRAEHVARELLRPHDRAVARAERVPDEPLAVEPPVVDGDAVVPDFAHDGVEQLRLRVGQALPPPQEVEPQRRRPPPQHHCGAEQRVPHRHGAARGVVAHLHALHPAPAELLGDVPGVHRDDRVPADERDALVPEVVAHRRREVVAREPPRHLLLPPLPRRRVPVHGRSDVRDERAPGAHDGGEHGLRRLPGHLAESGEDLAEERPRRALHGPFCYIVRHGETPSGCFCTAYYSGIGKSPRLSQPHGNLFSLGFIGPGEYLG